MGRSHLASDYAPIILSRDHLGQRSIRTEDDLKSYIARQHQEAAARFLWGGYLERRALYQSDLFLQDKEGVRDIHLGIDIWGIVYDLIYAPLPGRIHSFAYNDQDLDYGYTLILEHEVSDTRFYTLYGHLGDTYHHTWKVGKLVAAGEVIADLGPKTTNGGWLPHLHFQVMTDMMGKEGDFPGVCSEQHLRKYKEVCPDPINLIKGLKNP